MYSRQHLCETPRLFSFLGRLDRVRVIEATIWETLTEAKLNLSKRRQKGLLLGNDCVLKWRCQFYASFTALYAFSPRLSPTKLFLVIEICRRYGEAVHLYQKAKLQRSSSSPRLVRKILCILGFHVT